MCTVYTFLHHVITMFHFSDEVEVDEAKSCGFIGFLRNTGPMQNKVLRWLIVTRCDKMWQDVTSSGCSCKMSIDPLVTLVFYSMIEFQGNPLAIGFFGILAIWAFAWVRTSLRRCFGAATLPRFVSGHLGWSFTVIHNTFWYFLDVWTSFEPRKESVAKAVQQPNLGLQHP